MARRIEQLYPIARGNLTPGLLLWVQGANLMVHIQLNFPIKKAASPSVYRGYKVHDDAQLMEILNTCFG